LAGVSELIHGTAVSITGKAVLIRGPSGSGKSDLALRCITAAPSPLLGTPALLIADDQVLATRQGERVLLRAPDAIGGRLEVRGIGVVALPFVSDVELALIVDLVPSGAMARLPDPRLPVEIIGIFVPAVDLDATEVSAPQKLFLALRQALGPGLAGAV
jgi:serine kinase of HPr protein (carbohydrate metabolism regulator)